VRTCTTGTWSFEDGTVDGFSLLTQVGGSADGIAVSTARASHGTHSLAIATTFNCSRTAFQVVMYPCGLGTPVNFAGKTLTFKVFFEGPAFLDGPVEPASVIYSQPARTVAITPAVNTWISVSIPLGAGDSSDDGISFETYMQTTGPAPGFVCGTWAGTVYLDGFTVQ